LWKDTKLTLYFTDKHTNISMKLDFRNKLVENAFTSVKVAISNFNITLSGNFELTKEKSYPLVINNKSISPGSACSCMCEVCT